MTEVSRNIELYEKSIHIALDLNLIIHSALIEKKKFPQDKHFDIVITEFIKIQEYILSNPAKEFNFSKVDEWLLEFLKLNYNFSNTQTGKSIRSLIGKHLKK